MAQSLPKMVKQSYVTRAYGRNLGRLVAQLAIDKPSTAVLELLANAYDADATSVELDYSPELRQLTVTDNGSGMDSEGLAGFYRLGDSPKEFEPVSPKYHRTRIGKFGIGAILLGYLGNSFELVTDKEGTRLTSGQVFGEDSYDPETKIPYTPSSVDPKLHGTKITLYDLKFDESHGLDLKKLRQKIQHELPILPDFQINVNGKPIEARAMVKGEQYLFQHHGDAVGHVQGILYVTGRQTKMAGFHVYVNERRVGDPHKIAGFSDLRGGSREKIVGIIEAPGLEQAILFNRGGFDEGHPAYVEFERALRKFGHKIEYQARTRKGKSDSLRSKQDGILTKIQKQLGKAEIDGVNLETHLKIVDKLPEDIDGHSPGYFDGFEITLNAQHPSLDIGSHKNAQTYEAAVQQATIDTLAIALMPDGDNTITGFLEIRDTLVQKLNTKEVAPTRKEEIHPDRLYMIGECATELDIGVGGVNYLVKGKVMKPIEGSIVGRELQKAKSKLNGHTTLYDVLHVGKLSVQPQNMERAHTILKRAGDAIHPFIRKEGSCFLVERSVLDGIVEAMGTDSIDLRKQSADCSRPFQELHELEFSIPDLGQRLGLSVQDVTAVIDYASEKGIEINSNVKKGNALFRYGDFVYALQQRRGEL